MTGPKPGGYGAWSSTHVQVTPRPCRAGRRRSEPKRFPPTTGDPMPSASARKVPHYAVSPAPKMKRPWATIGPIRTHPR